MNLFGELTMDKVEGALNGYQILLQAGVEIKAGDSFKELERYSQRCPWSPATSLDYRIPVSLFRVLRKHLLKEDKEYLHLYRWGNCGYGRCIYTFRDDTWCFFSYEYDNKEGR